jgi:NADH-quinone oxidoreductase subunit L
VSQLGYMMAAAGAGAASAGFFHLLTHGVFKALLFLGAGAVIHAVGTNDVFRMGGLARAMPHTTIVFVIGTLALAGVPPLAGFFSKEAVLGGVWAGGMTTAFVLLSVTAFLTAFYMFRVVILAFFGRAHSGGHPHEAPPLMRGPLWILAILTVAIGLRYAVGGGAAGMPHGPGWLAPFSIGLAVAGILLAWLVYQRGAIDPASLADALKPVDFMARRRYGLDALYVALYRGLILGFSRVVGWLDRYLVDGILNVFSAWSLRAGDLTRRIQTGQPQDYLYGVAFGVLLVVVWARWWSR